MTPGGRRELMFSESAGVEELWYSFMPRDDVLNYKEGVIIVVSYRRCQVTSRCLTVRIAAFSIASPSMPARYVTQQRIWAARATNQATSGM